MAVATPYRLSEGFPSKLYGLHRIRTCLNLDRMALRASGVLPMLRAYPCWPVILRFSISATRVVYGNVHSLEPTIAQSVSNPDRFSR